jgi:endonuclease/exonuclease/phosphatase family metal-dependent hydrolase
MRLATFNLESLDDRPGTEPSLAARIAVLAPALERLDADILCLQEVNAQRPSGKGPRGFAALDALLDAAGLIGFERAVTTNRAGSGPADVHNLVTLARTPIIDSRQIWHDFVPPPHHAYVTAEGDSATPVEISWDRPVLYTKVGIKDGATLHLFNVHLRAPLASPVPGQKRGEFA